MNFSQLGGTLFVSPPDKTESPNKNIANGTQVKLDVEKDLHTNIKSLNNSDSMGKMLNVMRSKKSRQFLVEEESPPS